MRSDPSPCPLSNLPHCRPLLVLWSQPQSTCLQLYTYYVFCSEVPGKKCPTEQCIYRLTAGGYVGCSEACQEVKGRQYTQQGKVCKSVESQHLKSYQSHTQALCLGFTLETPQEATGLLLQPCGSSGPSNKPGNWVRGQHKYNIGHTSHWLKAPQYSVWTERCLLHSDVYIFLPMRLSYTKLPWVVHALGWCT